ncbi:MAG TPA: molybdopterin cofactor-binding domain-containing protein [Vicinamibacteria bacterium]
MGSLSGAALLLDVAWSGRVAAAPAASFRPNAWLRVGADGAVAITVGKSEMGQGVRTSLPMLVAEELEVDLAAVELVQAVPGPEFKRLRTGGSGSVYGSYAALRKAGAAAREMLVSAAAAAWGVDVNGCRADKGSVVHGSTGRRLAYARLVEAASRLPVPAEPRVKETRDLHLVGRPTKRIDGLRIVTGRALYGLDTRVPGMRQAVVARPPVLGGSVLRWDATRARAIAGVRDVVKVPTGIAVVADDTWAALQGRDALDITWDDGPNAGFDSDAFRRRLAEAAQGPGHLSRREGPGRAALAGAARRLDATYEYPFQAHAPLETMNTVAEVRSGGCEIWSPTQAPEQVRDEAAKVLGLSPDAVRVNVTLIGGGFGRRLGIDYAVEAVHVSKAVGGPVQVVWTRPDDMRHGHFQPASAHRMAAGLDADGRLVVWGHRKAGSYLSIFPAPTAAEMQDPAHWQDESWGAYDIPYAIPAIETDYVLVDSPVPSGPWRAVYSPSSTFARESFLDEVAHAAGRDPRRLRLDLLAGPSPVTIGGLTIDRTRLRRVLETATAKAGWGEPLPKGRGRGLAANVYDGDTHVAMVAEVTVAGGAVHVDRVVAAVDCGPFVNPLHIERQVESGVVWALATIFFGEITIAGGRVQQSSYGDYAVPRLRHMPVVETHILPATVVQPSGIGEAPVPPLAPAVLNAVFAATGRRVRRLPVRPTDLA